MDVAQVAFTWKEGSGFQGSNQTTLFLHFPLLRCLPRIWLDIVWLRELWNCKAGVFYVNASVCESSAASGKGGGGTWVVTQLKIATVTSTWPDSTLWVIYDQPSSLLLHLAYGNDPGLREGHEGWVVKNMNATKASVACFCCLSLDRILFLWPFARLPLPFIC